MPNDKPTIFLSHSSSDKQALTQLKNSLAKKTGQTIDIFLSSDGQSIQVGRNWVHRIEDALNRAKIVFVFVSPNSLQSKWLFFESGFSYSKGIRVIPVAILGIDLDAVPPPLSLLQGFNVRSHEGLNNIIHIINEEFGYSFEDAFVPEDYAAIFGEYAADSDQGFGEFTHLIQRLRFWIQTDGSTALSKVKSLLDGAGIQYQDLEGSVHAPGLSFSVNNDVLDISVDPDLVAMTLPFVEKVYEQLEQMKDGNFSFQLTFTSSVGRTTERYKLTSKLYRSGIGLAPTGAFVFENIEFKLEAFRGGRTPDRVHIAYLDIKLRQDRLEHLGLVKLLRLLFDREVLFLRENQ